MTEKPFCVISKQSNNDYERYSKGKFTLEEWEDVNYCEHCFSMDDEGLNDKEVVDLLNSLSEENEQLKEEIKDFQTLLASREETYIKPVLRLIDLKMEALKPYNSELCRRVLAELKMEIKGEM